MVGGKLLVLISTSLGVIYRSIYTEDINTLKKFVISLTFSIVLGIAWVAYVDEEKIRVSISIVIGVVIGLLSSNIASTLLKIGKNSENTIANVVNSYLKSSIPNDSKQKNVNDDPE